jgi:hypothetical protein
MSIAVLLLMEVPALFTDGITLINNGAINLSSFIMGTAAPLKRLKVQAASTLLFLSHLMQGYYFRRQPDESPVN